MPIIFIDVGAAKGLPPLWKKIASKLRVIGFEPDPRSIDYLRKNPEGGNSLYLETGLYKEKVEISLYLTRDHRKSSILEPNMDFLKKFANPERTEVIKVIPVKVDTLDNQLKENKIDDADFIKIDIQGSELFMLEGAKNILPKIYGLEIEVSFVDRYKNQPLFGEVDTFMNKLGFRLIDIKPYYWKRKNMENFGGWKGQAVIGKALYFKSDISIQKAKALNAIEIACLYGYQDIAHETFMRIKNQLSDDEQKDIESRFKASAHFFGRNSIAKCFFKVYKFFETEKTRKFRQNSLLGNLTEK